MAHGEISLDIGRPDRGHGCWLGTGVVTARRGSSVVARGNDGQPRSDSEDGEVMICRSIRPILAGHWGNMLPTPGS